MINGIFDVIGQYFPTGIFSQTPAKRILPYFNNNLYIANEAQEGLFDENYQFFKEMKLLVELINEGLLSMQNVADLKSLYVNNPLLGQATINSILEDLKPFSKLMKNEMKLNDDLISMLHRENRGQYLRLATSLASIHIELAKLDENTRTSSIDKENLMKSLQRNRDNASKAYQLVSISEKSLRNKQKLR